ncbi:hypothetical protein GCM10023156_62500 [Novipirellula rosea]|uniref:Uncharacterized protein n=1 Tax=Novipirellula rosea TaxID=1031540 RepID=A0ABP8NN79_9BACT
MSLTIWATVERVDFCDVLSNSAMIRCHSISLGVSGAENFRMAFESIAKKRDALQAFHAVFDMNFDFDSLISRQFAIEVVGQ